MGANQSHADRDDSDFSDSSNSSDPHDLADHSNQPDCTTIKKTSYLEHYPDPLGHFKSFHVIEDIDRIIATHIEATPRSKWFRKINIAFSHKLHVRNPRADLFLSVSCKVNKSIREHWRVKANFSVKIRNFNNDSDSGIYDCGDLRFLGYNSDSRPVFLKMLTNISLVDFIYEGSPSVKNNEMIVEVDIRVLEVEGFHQPLVINYRLPPVKSKNSFRISHPNVIFYCNTAISNACVKPGSHRMKFKQPSSGSFEELLDLVYGFPVPISNRISVRNLLKLSQSFKISAVIQRVETTIIQRSKMNHSYRKIAVKFNLRRVMHSWLNKQESINKKDVEDLDVEKMSGEIMKAIVKKVFEVGWKMEDKSEEEQLLMSELVLWYSYKN